MGATLVAVHGLLIVAASLVGEHRPLGMRASVVAAPGLKHRLNSCGAWA